MRNGAASKQQIINHIEAFPGIHKFNVNVNVKQSLDGFKCMPQHNLDGSFLVVLNANHNSARQTELYW